MRPIFALVLTLPMALWPSASSLSAESTSNHSPTLDVLVEDARGRVVDTLSAADFTVTEQARAVPVESVRFVGSSKATDASVVPVSVAPKTPSPDTGALVAVY